MIPSDGEKRPSLDDDIAMQERFNEAHQGIMGMLFAAYKMRGRQLRADERSLPLTIIGGFLGSGKTTLLNHLLVSPHGRKLVVLVNDFGRILPESLLRAKGVLCLAEAPDRRTIYQRVGKRWSYKPAEPWGDEQPHSSLVFIAPRGELDESTLEAGILACRTDR